MQKVYILDTNALIENPDCLEVFRNRQENKVLIFIKGMNIDDAIVIIDEAQNITRYKTRALLTRMGEHVCLAATVPAASSMSFMITLPWTLPAIFASSGDMSCAISTDPPLTLLSSIRRPSMRILSIE